MNQPPSTMNVELEDKDVRKDLSEIVNAMSKMRAETIKDRKLRDEQKDEYLHMSYRLASGIKAVADEPMIKKMQIVAERLNKNPDILKYDPMQDGFWRKKEGRFTDALDDLLFSIVSDDFHSVDAKHHVLQAVKYLGVEDASKKEREEVYDTILPFHGPVLLGTRESLVKKIFGRLFGNQYKISNLDELALHIDATGNGFTDEFIQMARDRGYTTLRVDISEKDFKRLGGEKKEEQTYKVLENKTPEIGDMVIGIGIYEEKEVEGLKGKIVHFRQDSSIGIGIEWEKNFGGHHCEGRCNNGRGWYVRRENFKIVRYENQINSNLELRVNGQEFPLNVVDSKDIPKNQRLINFADGLVRYTKPISYLFLGALPRSLQDRLDDTLPTFNKKTAFASSCLTEMLVSAFGAVSITAWQGSGWYLLFGLPLVDGFARLNGGLDVDSRGIYEKSLGSAFLKPIFYPLEKYLDKRDNSARKTITVELPVRKIEASKQIPNPVAFYDAIGKMEVPEDIEKNLIWNNENHNQFGKSFIAYVREHAGTEPQGIEVATEIDKPNQAIVYHHELFVDGYRKYSSLFCFHGRRYLVTAIKHNIKTNNFIEDASKILSDNSDNEKKLEKLGKELNARYVHLKEYRSGQLTTDMESFG